MLHFSHLSSGAGTMGQLVLTYQGTRSRPA
jgi:hypothetical protein